MPAAGGRRGRRDNGLIAAEYEAVGDVDPRIGEHLLDVLAAGGIAAYLQPSTDLHPITRTTSLPARPTDRLFVDRDHLITAQDYIRQVTSDHDRVTTAESDTDVDAAWREIIAGYHLTAEPLGQPEPPGPSGPSGPPQPPGPPGPSGAPSPEAASDETREKPSSGTPSARSEGITLDEPRRLPHIEPPDRTRDRESDPTWEPEPRPGRLVDPAEPSLLDALDTFGAGLPDEEDEGYIPPPPPPLPRISAAAGLGVAAIALGLLLFIWPGLLPFGHDQVLLVAFGSIVAGFATLIWRLRPGDDDEEDDPDDGARV